MTGGLNRVIQPTEDFTDPRVLRTYLQKVTAAFNCPSFLMHRNNVDQAGLANGVATTIQFNSLAAYTNGNTGWDTHNQCDLVTNVGRWNCVVPGVYLLGMSWGTVAAVACDLTCTMTRNGVSATQTIRILGSAVARTFVQATVIMQFVKGDYIEFQATQNSGAGQAIAGSIAGTRAWGYRLPG